ncbi:DMT family transporter [Gordonia jinhuaensis]|uniref:Uncharacterized protein n=1 Tax=Gordonia jinhuaensis TaxID=1517702 RepID=A0A916T873_9ACTN|nr:DMT family transporter [Gordonia jinhuaensis]GGB33602.1 hypothetical protein GCM10011489_22190 [Gordonia jinhuaensis]
MHLFLPAVLAIVSALLVATGTLVRQRSSTSAGGITRRWWLGVGIAVIGFALQAVALALGTLLLVQPLIILSVLFALPMEAYLDKRRLTFAEWKWGIILTLCVAGFVLLTMPSPGPGRGSGETLGITAGVLIAIVILLVASTRFVPRHYRALIFGAASGLFTGVQAYLVKVVTGQLTDSVVSVFTHAQLYLILVVALLSVISQQFAFAAHDLQTSFPAMTATEPVVAMALGVVLLGERANVNAWEGVIVAVVGVMMLWAIIVLARHAAEREVEHEHSPDGPLQLPPVDRAA